MGLPRGVWPALCFYMEHTPTSDPAKTRKPYDIRERLFLFACDVVRVGQELHRRGPIAGALSVQLVSAAVNAASNLEEADDGSSGRDFRAKDRIALREIKEARSAIVAARYLSRGSVPP